MRFDKRTGILMFKPPISADVHCVFWAACADTVPAQGYLEQRDRLLQYRTDNSSAKSHCRTGCLKLM